MTRLAFIGQRDVDMLAIADPYYRGRWPYYEVAIAMARRAAPNGGTVLEVGPHKLSLVTGADTMDSNPCVRPTFVWDAGKTPWPTRTHYTLAIALQVWEHLRGRQGAAFSELARIADAAVMSFPYRWATGDTDHDGIDDARIAEWTLGCASVEHTQVTGRLVVRFQFR